MRRFKQCTVNNAIFLSDDQPSRHSDSGTRREVISLRRHSNLNAGYRLVDHRQYTLLTLLSRHLSKQSHLIKALINYIM